VAPVIFDQVAPLRICHWYVMVPSLSLATATAVRVCPCCGAPSIVTDNVGAISVTATVGVLIAEAVAPIWGSTAVAITRSSLPSSVSCST